MTSVRRAPQAAVLRWLSILVLAAGVNGCADLSAIRNYADQSLDAAQYTKLVNEFAEAPTREKAFQPADQQPNLERQAKERAEEKKRMLARLTAVQEYMSALGQLAADKKVVYDTQVDAVGKAVKDAKFGDQKEVDAIGSLAKILLRAVTDAWRQRQLHAIIQQANEPLQTVLKAQRDIVAKDFSQSLTNEETVITTYYDNFVRPPDAKKDVLGFAAVSELRDQRLQSFPARKQAAEDYVKILAKIAEAHQSLYDNREHIKSETLLQAVQKYANDIRAILNAVKELS